MWYQILQSFLHLIYPPICLHCNDSIKNPPAYLCDTCLELMELISPDMRCPYCFTADFEPQRLICLECKRHPLLIDKLIAAFDYIGPAATLIRKMKYSNQPYLAEGIAAWMCAQILRMEGDLPDVIVPVPLSFSHWIDRGYNQSALIAESMGRILQRPVWDILKRHSGDYSQAGLSKQQRMDFEKRIVIKKKNKITDKSILLVDDVMTTGSTLRKCAEVLHEEAPKKVEGIVFCRALY